MRKANSHRLLLTFAVVLAALLSDVAVLLADAPDIVSIFPQPAYAADQFVDFIGLSAAPFDRYLDSGPFKGAGSKFDPQLLFDLGVRHYRMVLKYELTRDDAAAKVKDAFDKYGIKPMFLIAGTKDGSPADVVQLLKTYGGNDVVSEVEFPNEVNNKFPPQELNLHYGGKHDEEAGALFPKGLFQGNQRRSRDEKYSDGLLHRHLHR